MASNLSLGFSVAVHQFRTGSPGSRQRPFRPGHQPLSGRLCGSLRRRAPVVRLPVSHCLFGYRPSLLEPSCARWGVEPSSRSAYQANQPPGPHRGCHVAHEQAATGQGASFTPGTTVRSRPANTLWSASAAFQRPVPTTPLEHPTGGGNRHEASTKVHSRSPIPAFSLPVTPGWNGCPWAFPLSSAPRSYPRRTSGWRQAITHWPGYYTFDISW